MQENKEEHITTIRSEAERVINRTLPVCYPLTEVMGVQHYRSYEAFLLGSHSSLVVFKEKIFGIHGQDTSHMTNHNKNERRQKSAHS